MLLQEIILIVFVFITFFNTGVQVYIHQEVYPLFAFVENNTLPRYLKEFEQRLVLPLMVPFLLTLLSNIALLFIRPAKMSLPFLIASLVLNVVTALVTVVLATPVYNRYKQGGESVSRELAALKQINLLRLGLSILTSLTVAYLLSQVLTV